MTVATTHVSNSFTGDGVQTVFNFTFHTLKPEHVQVLLAGVVQGAGYTVALNANQEQSPGGNVTITSPPGGGVAVKLNRNTSKTQDVGFSLESNLDTQKLELVFDKVTLLLQEAAASTQGQQGPQGVQGPQGPSGDIGGPVSSVDGAIPIWDGTGGNQLDAGISPVNDGDIMTVVSGAWAAAAAGATFPSGAVVLWPFDPATVPVPSGWDICDGRSVTINGVSRVTPDSRGKFILGAATDDTGSSGYTGSTVRPGTVAGTKTHNHANAGTVTVNATTASGSVSASGVAAGSGAFSAALNGTLNFTGNSHAHTASISGNNQANTEASRPIEVALLLIIKVD